MYDFLNASPEERIADRERQRRILANIPRNTVTATFLANRAAAMLDLQFRMEEGLLVLKNVGQPPANTPECTAVINILRSSLQLVNAEMGSMVLAARYDVESAAEALQQDEDLPGVPSSLLKATRTAFRTREEAAQKAHQEQQRLLARRRLQANANAAALAAPTATPAAPVAAAAPATVAAAGSGGAVYPRPVSAANPNRFRFPCDACGKTGHWKNEGNCKPEDIAAYAALLAATAPPAATPTGYPALPAPPGTTGRIRVQLLFLLSFSVGNYYFLFNYYLFVIYFAVCGFQPRAAGGVCGFQPRAPFTYAVCGFQPRAAGGVCGFQPRASFVYAVCGFQPRAVEKFYHIPVCIVDMDYQPL
jgi:hypothetical protein